MPVDEGKTLIIDFVSPKQQSSDLKKIRMPRFSETIALIENEIAFQYMGRCIKWVDDNFDNAWSNAIDRLEKALGEYATTYNVDKMDHECVIYYETCKELASKYKAHKGINEVNLFLAGIKEEPEEPNPNPNPNPDSR